MKKINQIIDLLSTIIMIVYITGFIYAVADPEAFGRMISAWYMDFMAGIFDAMADDLHIPACHEK